MNFDENDDEEYKNSVVVKYIRKLNPEYNIESLHKLKNAVNRLIKLKKSSEVFRSIISEPEPETIIKSGVSNGAQKQMPYKILNISSQIPSL
jgi:hypothetical protein